MKGRKKYYVVIIVLMIVAMMYGYYLYNKPVPSIANTSPNYTLSPAELINAFEQNEQDANKTYLDKIIQVEGQVDRVEAPKTLYIASGNPLSSLIFELEDSLILSSINAGDNIVIKGVCTGYLMDVVLNRAIIIDEN